MTATQTEGMYLNISTQAYRKLMSWAMAARLMDSEVSGLAEIEAAILPMERAFAPLKRDPGSALPPGVSVQFALTDAWLVGSSNTGAETNITPRDMARFAGEHMDRNGDLSIIKCWWHVHPMADGWSGTDEHAIRATPLGGSPADIGWSVSLVHTEYASWIARYDQYGDVPLTITLPVLVDGLPAGIEAQCYNDVRTLIVKSPSFEKATSQMYFPDLGDEPDWRNEFVGTCPSCDNLLTEGDVVCPGCQMSLTDYQEPHMPDTTIYSKEIDYGALGHCDRCGEAEIAVHVPNYWMYGCPVCDYRDYVTECPSCDDWAVLQDDDRYFYCSSCDQFYDAVEETQ